MQTKHDSHTHHSRPDHRSSVQKRAQLHYNLGRALSKKGDLDGAIASLQKALEIVPDWSIAKESLQILQQERQKVTEQVILHQATDHYNSGKSLLEKGEYTGAIACFRQAVEIHPNFLDAHLCLANTLMKGEEIQEAINIYEKVLGLKDDLWEVHHKLGNLYRQLQKRESAIAAYERSIELKSDFPWNYDKLADLLVELEEWQRAIVCYENLVELQPDFAWGYYKLGDVCGKLERWDGAVQAYRLAVKLDGGLPEIYEKLGDGLCHVNPQNVEEICRVYQQAIEKNPDNLQLYYQVLEVNPQQIDITIKLADILQKQGRLEQAVVFYQRVLQLKNINFEVQKSILKKLEQLKRLDNYLEDSIKSKPDLVTNHQNINIQNDNLYERNMISYLSENQKFNKLTNTVEWSAIITMWKRIEYLEEQIEAIRQQSVAPVEIIIIINGNHISELQIRNITGQDVKIIKSDLNSLYSRWAIAYVATGEYVCIFDDDVIPGKHWIANGIRACSKYQALVGPSGRIYNQNGKHNYYKLVMPASQYSDDQTIDCSETDIYCDWVCNSYLFKREWVKYALGSIRYQNSYKTFDDIQLATSLFLYGHIKCVVPMQPEHNKQLHGSLKNNYGNDVYAIWKTNSEHHFSQRKKYIEDLIEDGYIPVQERDNLYKIHLIIPFGERKYLERCLLSIKGQDYQNYTFTLIDDCHDGGDSLELIKRLGLEKKNFNYLKTTKRLYPLRSREVATDFINANPADIIAHLDGDDWLPYPDVLSRLNRVYRTGQIMLTYGNTIECKNPNLGKSSTFSEYKMSRRWNVAQNELNSEIMTFRDLTLDEITEDWRKSPWCAMHMRTFQFVKWLGLNRTTFLDSNGKYLRVATDAAIFIPILNTTKFKSILFIPEISYVYQNYENTIHAKKEITETEKNEALTNINKAIDNINYGAINNALLGLNQNTNLENIKITYRNNHLDKKFGFNCEPTNFNKTLYNKNTAVVTIITPDFLPYAIICLKSYSYNLRSQCSLYVFLATENEEEIYCCTDILSKLDIACLSPKSLKFTSEYSMSLIQKYSLKSDEYRWAMKSVIIMELLECEYQMVLFLDPDTYTVSDITSTHHTMLQHPISIFPHFRDPDHEYLRSVLYRDGFFNGGMIAATKEGFAAIENLYKRCLNEMNKDPSRQRWDDQKYFDLFILETPNIFINLDRGIDYNPWNYELVEGLVSPSQRSYILKSGFYVKHWHVSTKMIENAVKAQESVERYGLFQPIVTIYLLTVLYTIILLVAEIKRSKNHPDNLIFNLLTIFDKIITQLQLLSKSIPINNLADLLVITKNINEDNYSDFIKTWSESLYDSILFDNFEVLADIASSLCTDPKVSHAINFLRQQDIRYLTDKVLCCNNIDHETLQSITSKLDVGNLIKRRIQILNSYNIMNNSTKNCNICSSLDFIDFNGRKKVKCAKCGSIERHRMVYETLSQLGFLNKNEHLGLKRVLHIAPDSVTHSYLFEVFGSGYYACDSYPENYPHCQTLKIAFSDILNIFPKSYFDLIVHNHFLQYIPGNYQDHLKSLETIMKPDSYMVFTTLCILSDKTIETGENTGLNQSYLKKFGKDFLEYLSQMDGNFYTASIPPHVRQKLRGSNEEVYIFQKSIML